MPSITDIKDCVRNSTLIKDDFIKGGQFEMLPTGEPVMFTGGFTAVFPVIIKKEKWAFRCWHSDLGNVKRRMELISKDLKKSSLPYFCDFAYVDEGIVVGGKVYPTTRMRWVEGLTLKEYICAHPDKKDLLKLADNFLTMCRELHCNHYAHGDLQHGNIMVSPNGDIYLIDYDSMHVPSMQGFGNIIGGLKDYQHPKRKDSHYSSEKLDYFSELIIYISILAIAERPAFIDEYKVEDSEMLLFSADDYKQIKQSDIYVELQSLKGIFPLLLLILEEYLGKDNIEQLQPFEVLLERLSTPPIIKQFKSKSGKCIYKGTEVELSWEVENGTNFYLNGKGLNATSKRYVEKLSDNKTYSLEVVNGFHKVSSEIKIEVVDAPRISIKLSSRKIRQGKQEKTILKWSVEHAKETKLYVGNEERVVENRGEIILSPLETTYYRISAIGLDGQKVFEKQVTLYVLSESIIEFTADKLFTLPKVPIQLSWRVKNAKSVELVGYGVREMEGKHTVEIEKNTIFELNVMDAFGLQKRTIEIKILPLPIIKGIMTPTPEISKKVAIQTKFPNLQATIPALGNLSSPIDTSRLSLPNFEGIKVEMKELPMIVSTPNFHLLQLDIGRVSWWRKLKNKFRELNTYLQNIK